MITELIKNVDNVMDRYYPDSLQIHLEYSNSEMKSIHDRYIIPDPKGDLQLVKK